MKLFDETMTSAQAREALWRYADAHRGEDMEEVRQEYKRVAAAIAKRELEQNTGRLTADAVAE